LGNFLQLSATILFVFLPAQSAQNRVFTIKNAENAAFFFFSRMHTPAIHQQVGGGNRLPGHPKAGSEPVFCGFPVFLSKKRLTAWAGEL
jgi:hypothetical protein